MQYLRAGTLEVARMGRISILHQRTRQVPQLRSGLPKNQPAPGLESDDYSLTPTAQRRRLRVEV